MMKVFGMAGITMLLPLASALAFAQAQGAAAANPSPVATVSRPSSGQAPLQQRYPRYSIQRSDVLLLSFPRSPEFNQTVTVQPDGFVNLQNSGSLHVQGMTVPELIIALQGAYSHVLHNPIINVDLEDFQKPFFTVSGQVGKPGQYELRSDITLAEGLAVAGGMSPTAKTQVFLFHRTSTDWYAVREVRMNEILNGKNIDEDPVLQPGDMIYVPEKFIANFRKYVPYAANTGAYVNQY